MLGGLAMTVPVTRVMALGVFVLLFSALVLAADNPGPAAAPSQPGPVKAEAKKQPEQPVKPGEQMPQQAPSGARDEHAAAVTLPPGNPDAKPPLPKPKAAFVPNMRVNPKTGHEVIVITNKDLERVFGKSEAPPPPSAGAQLPQLGGPGAQAPAAEDPAAKAAAIQQELDRLSQKAKHLRNPYLRPAPETDAERQAEKGMGAVQRLQATEDRINQLKSELQKVQERRQSEPATGK
jgi:hypothetical protein